MTEPLPVILAAGALGAGGGALYFAALWHAVRRLGAEGGYGRFALAGALRLGAVLAAVGLVLWLGAGPMALLAAGVGFLAARMAAARLARRPEGRQ